jgi:signal transduction histidine kinase
VGLEPALSGLCEEITKQCNIEVRFTEPECPLNLPKSVALCLFRIAQEALANVVKHSHARTAQVELTADSNGVCLRISDTGTGFDHDLKKSVEGIGLISMRERLRLVGGRLSVFSGPTQGSEIVAEIPLSIPANEDQETATHAILEMES